MNTNENVLLDEINQTITALEKMKENVLSKLPFSYRLKKGQWVINKSTKTHFQFMEISNSNNGDILLKRFGKIRQINSETFNSKFVVATPEQVENHLRYLNKNGLVYDGKPILDLVGSLNSVSADKLESIETRALRTLEEWRNESKIQLPEFYLITVEGKIGCKVRHPDFQTAATEAKRLAKLCNHRAHIVGVVAIVEPVEVQKPITEYQLITK